MSFYHFSVVFPNYEKEFFVKEKIFAKEWTKQLRSSLGYKNIFDYYNLIDDLGQGSFGVVKLAINLETLEKVAIKIINKKKMESGALELAMREIDIMKKCQHPNIIKYYEHYENSEFIFIVMEYIKHSTLGDYLKKNKGLDQSTCAAIISQIASGIQYLHDFGIVHRDLKPGNIMISSLKQGICTKITDFGLSKILTPNDTTTESYGTLVFTAPEILKHHPYNKSVDVWSLGIITYFLLFRIYPFADKFTNEKTIMKRILEGKVNIPEIYLKHKELIDYFDKCLEKDESKRISIAEVLNHPWIKNNIEK